MTHLILYDGVCGLCQGVVQWVLARDVGARFRFAALQSALAQQRLAALGVPRVELNTFYVVVDQDGPHARLLERSSGALFVMEQLGGVLSWAAWLRVVPRTWRDAAYDLLARNRDAWFGNPRACLVPTEKMRARFLDMAPPSM